MESAKYWINSSRSQPIFLGLSSGEDQVDDVVLDLVVDLDLIDHCASRDDGLGAHDRAISSCGRGWSWPCGRGSLAPAPVWVIHDELEHEAVDLASGSG